MGYFVHKRDGNGDGRPPHEPPIPREDEAVACVPFVPWRCPKCGSLSPRTYGQRGRVRYHRCECGLRFRSIEVSPEAVDAALQQALDAPPE